MNQRQKRDLLFVYSFTGCDTVSSIYGYGKTKLFTKLTSDDFDDDMSLVFNDIRSKQEAITATGIKAFQYISGGTKNQDIPLNKQRYFAYSKYAAVGKIAPERLPPIEGAAKQHSLRAYIQTRDWLLLDSQSKNPENYGWKRTADGSFEPVATTDPIAPQSILKIISCNCKAEKKRCGGTRCGCKKFQVKCCSACGTCHGIDCLNSIQDRNIIEVDDVEDDDIEE